MPSRPDSYSYKRIFMHSICLNGVDIVFICGSAWENWNQVYCSYRLVIVAMHTVGDDEKREEEFVYDRQLSICYN